MKIWIPILLLGMAWPGDDDEGPAKTSKRNHLWAEGLKGRVKTEETTEGNTAVFANGAWTVKEKATNTVWVSYTKSGYYQSGKDLVNGAAVKQYQAWFDEDGVHNTLATEAGNEEKPELIIREYDNDTILAIKTYLCDEDTLTTEQLEEEVRTVMPTGYRRDLYSVSKDKKRRYMYIEKAWVSADTFHTTYYGESSTRYVNAVLERDAAGNPLKILNCGETDTLLTTKKYTYY